MGGYADPVADAEIERLCSELADWRREARRLQRAESLLQLEADGLRDEVVRSRAAMANLSQLANAWVANGQDAPRVSTWGQLAACGRILRQRISELT